MIGQVFIKKQPPKSLTWSLPNSQYIANVPIIVEVRANSMIILWKMLCYSCFLII